MTYESHCRQVFNGVELDIEDLYLLESYQIDYLQHRAPKRNLAAVLKAYPSIKRFFVAKSPTIENFLGEISARFDAANDDEELDRLGDSLVWEIADMLIYCKYPWRYDQVERPGWRFEDILEVVSIDDKIVIDGGAGTGKVAFEAAEMARHVFAVEPNSSMRHFIRQKAEERSVRNVYPIDGFLDSIPLPDGAADVLITSKAIGWSLDAELQEMERVVKPGGHIVHALGYSTLDEADPLIETLTSSQWRYECVSSEHEGTRQTVCFKRTDSSG